MATKKRRVKVVKNGNISVSVVTEAEMITCPDCHGTGVREIEHGLMRLRCRACTGKGKIKIPAGG
jgi:DnaJ-class molecular chaperone